MNIIKKKVKKVKSTEKYQNSESSYIQVPRYILSSSLEIICSEEPLRDVEQNNNQIPSLERFSTETFLQQLARN